MRVIYTYNTNKQYESDPNIKENEDNFVCDISSCDKNISENKNKINEENNV